MLAVLAGALTGVPRPLPAQAQVPDTVFLKGGGSLVGTIVEDHVGDYLLIKVKGAAQRVEYANVLRRVKVSSSSSRRTASPAPSGKPKPPVPEPALPTPATTPPAAQPRPTPPVPPAEPPASASPMPERQPRLNLSLGTTLPSSDLQTVAEYGFSFKASYAFPITRLPLLLRPTLSLHQFEVSRFSGSGYFVDLVGGLDLMISPSRNADLRPFVFAGGLLGERLASPAHLSPTGPYFSLASTIMSSRLISGFGAGAGVEFAPFVLEAGVSHLRIKGATTIYFPLQFGFTF